MALSSPLSKVAVPANPFLEDVLEGLSTNPKTLPCKYFYDTTGSALFERICDCKDYYITRTEIALLEEIAPELRKCLGQNIALIEPGAGALRKVSILLEALDDIAFYMPMDISGPFLKKASALLSKDFPNLAITPLIGDFTDPLDRASIDKIKGAARNIIFFPGSTFGNFTPEGGRDFLCSMRELASPGGGMIIGLDLVKDITVLEQAYNDREGITAAFNMNILTRINNELGANFNLSQFVHKAFFEKARSRIEMHLVSLKDQTVHLSGHEFDFSENETIHTENSCKFTKEGFEQMAEATGFQPRKFWTDSKGFFGIYYLEVAT